MSCLRAFGRNPLLHRNSLPAIPTCIPLFDLWYYYYDKVNKLLNERGLKAYGWEEAGMRKHSSMASRIIFPTLILHKASFQLDVWNNMLGWGAEDLAYRLANAGYEIVLSPVSNMIFRYVLLQEFR